jgi:hypothetical protein
MRITIRDPIEYEVLAVGLGFTEGPIVAGDRAVYCVGIDGDRVPRLSGAQVVAGPRRQP